MPVKNYPHLTSYLTPKFYLKSEGPQPVVLPTDEESARLIIQRMECDLSPENLSCDGELSHREIMARLNKIMRAKGDLELILGRKIELDY